MMNYESQIDGFVASNTHSELFEFARSRGIKVAKRWNKVKIAEAIVAADEDQAEAEAAAVEVSEADPVPTLIEVCGGPVEATRALVKMYPNAKRSDFLELAASRGINRGTAQRYFYECRS